MSDLIEALRANPLLLGVCVVVLGLMVGSFLNVVILRLPRMMEAEWKQDCRLVLELPEVEEPKLSLMSPPSRCPGCGAPIRAWQNIPVISWVVLRGRCAKCATPISIQYPLVELVTGILSGVCVWRFGFSPQLAAALVLTWALVALTVIDLREQLLPDIITLPLVWLGLGMATLQVFATTTASIWGGIAGYLSLWSIYWIFKLATGKDGMGAGDFKLLAALGAWFGIGSLLGMVLLSSVVGSVVGITLMVTGRAEWSSKIPFGPYIAGAGWLYLIWGGVLQNLLHFGGH